LSDRSAPQRVERRRLLANVALFSPLGDAELDELLEVTHTRHLDDGEVLFRKGDAGRRLYGVVEGRLKISSQGPDGKEVIFGLADPGDVTGEIALLDAQPRSATVVALARSELLTLDRRDFLPFLERHPRLAIRLAEILAGRLRRLSELTEDSVLLVLRVRLAKKLLSLAASYGRETPAGTTIELELSQQSLGEMVGTSRESINSSSAPGSGTAG
jgi:CRP-like cAMP-binding protein